MNQIVFGDWMVDTEFDYTNVEMYVKCSLNENFKIYLCKANQEIHWWSYPSLDSDSKYREYYKDYVDYNNDKNIFSSLEEGKLFIDEFIKILPKFITLGTFG
jgi:hypothetical protein